MKEETERLRNANKILKNHIATSISVGSIPIPIVDLVVLSGIQIRMLHKLAQLYDIPFSKNMGKSLIGALLGGILPTSATIGIAGSLSKFIPIEGTVIGIVTFSAFGGASTYAIGKVFIQHFEAGGTFLTFDPTQMRKSFEEQFKKGQEQAKTWQEESPKQEEGLKEGTQQAKVPQEESSKQEEVVKEVTV